MSKYYVYSLKRNNIPIYVGCTNEKNLETRKNRHLKKISNIKNDILGNETFNIEELFDTESMAISYEMSLSCYYSFLGYNLVNKKFGNKYKPGLNLKGRNKGKVRSDDFKKNLSNYKKKLIASKKIYREILLSYAEARKKKIYRSDGFVYCDSISCKKELKVSSKRFKEILDNNLEFKGYKFSREGFSNEKNN